MKKISYVFLIFIFSGFYMPSFGIEEITLHESTDFKKRIAFELPLDKPKKILLENLAVNEFSPILNFQGVYDANISSEKSNFTYPIIVEGGGELKFNNSKSKFRVISNFTRNVDELDNRFLGKLSDVYFEHNFNKNHKVLLGNSRIPIGLEGGKGQYELLFAKRAQIGSKLGNARALGARFRGNFGYIDYDLGGYSSTRQLQDITDGVEFAGRVNYKPFYDNKDSLFKDFKLGISINTGISGQGYTVSSASAEWQNKKFLLNAEYAYADGSNALKYNPIKQEGFYATAAYNLTDNVQAAFRYDILDYNTEKSGDAVQKYTIGLNYYVIGQRLRFGLDYIYTQNGDTLENSSSSNAIHFITQVMI